MHEQERKQHCVTGGFWFLGSIQQLGGLELLPISVEVRIPPLLSYMRHIINQCSIYPFYLQRFSIDRQCI